jgi:hypothetical protein
LYVIVWYCMLLYVIVWYCMLLYVIVWYCMVFALMEREERGSCLVSSKILYAYTCLARTGTGDRLMMMNLSSRLAWLYCRYFYRRCRAESVQWDGAPMPMLVTVTVMVDQMHATCVNQGEAIFFLRRHYWNAEC